ncbi:TraR/DksA C4-type zinc finger protein [Haloferula chungangensis]|uniref:TraR/DksA C4-type zinc finger protein n=1 Tax=Haloferula chungangensis TaxID=1048331 RepID=A0ABW2L682_9BACT
MKPAKKAPKKAAPAKKAVKKVAPGKKPAPAVKATKKAAPENKAAAPKKVASKTKDSVKKTTPAKKDAPAKSEEPTKPQGPVKLTAFAVKQRQRLLDLRDELVDAMSGVAGEIKDAASGSDASGSGMHQGDAGSDAYDRDFALSMLAKEQDALYEIEQALKRIDRGVYGICEISGAKIPQPRLEALPFARLTVDCQAKWERDYGTQRFRPAAEIGFSNGYFPDGEDSTSVSLDGDD